MLLNLKKLKDLNDLIFLMKIFLYLENDRFM